MKLQVQNNNNNNNNNNNINNSNNKNKTKFIINDNINKPVEQNRLIREINSAAV
jgi:hypothetical protein